MKTVGIDELKRRLSSVLREVERDEKVLITRHNRQIAQLTPTGSEGVHRGARFGRGDLDSVLRKGTGGAYLETLKADRRANTEN